MPSTRSTDTVGLLAPTATRVILRPNPYQRGRANLIVYNWSHQPATRVDLGAVLRPGQAYRIVRPDSLWGTPVVTGTWSGPVTVPTPAEFHAFVVLPR